jgi:hypothetical protein
VTQGNGWRDEYLNVNLLTTMEDSWRKIEAWLQHHKRARPHGSRWNPVNSQGKLCIIGS